MWRNLLLLLIPLLLCVDTLHAEESKSVAPTTPMTSAPTKPTGRSYIVMIDPGHGGVDSGAVSSTTAGTTLKSKSNKTTFTEKELTLLLSKDLAAALNQKGFEAHLTREKDQEVSLMDRTAMANKMKASIFVSIHLNSLVAATKGKHASAQPQGIETYILNNTTDQSSKRLADLENSVLKDSKVVQASKTGDIALIVKDLILDANLKPSKDLACSVQLKVQNMAKNRGIRQALFYVLLGADMPSILIEAGFMGSAKDRDRILNPVSRKKLAAAIAEGFQDFRLRKRDPKIAARIGSCKVIEE